MDFPHGIAGTLFVYGLTALICFPVILDGLKRK